MQAGIRKQEVIKRRHLAVGQQTPQAAEGLGLGGFACRHHEALDARDPWAHDPFRVQAFGCQLEKQGWFVVFEGPLHEPRFEPFQVCCGSITVAEVVLDFAQMVGPRLRALRVLAQALRRDLHLLGHIAHNPRWGAQEVVRREAHVAQRTQLQGKAQPIRVAAMLQGFSQLKDRQGELRDALIRRNHRGETAKPLALRLAEELSWHPLPLTPSSPSPPLTCQRAHHKRPWMPQ